MTPRERILATIERRPVDRVPVDLWLTPEVLDSLRGHTGVEDEYQLYQTLGVDKIAWVFPGYRAEKFDPNEGEGLDPWGVPLHKVKSGMATYMEYGKPQLTEIDDRIVRPRRKAPARAIASTRVSVSASPINSAMRMRSFLALVLGCAVAGFFVRNARSASHQELVAFLRQWAAGTL
jgi:hypothetical protein